MASAQAKGAPNSYEARHGERVPDFKDWANLQRFHDLISKPHRDIGAQDTYRLLSNTDWPDLTRRAVTAII
jgi:hypothetical protein